MQIIKAAELKRDYLTTLIYAAPGMGKTTLLSKAKGKTLVIDVDKGTSVLRGVDNVDIVRLSDDLHEMPEIFKELQAKCDYQNIAIDSLSELERAMLTYYGYIGKNNGVPGIEAYNRVDFKILNYCRQFRSLEANIIFTAWEKIRDISTVTGEKYSQAYPMLRDKIVDNICGLCDIIGHIVVDSGERFVSFESSANAIAKDRIFKRKICNFEEVFNGD